MRIGSSAPLLVCLVAVAVTTPGCLMRNRPIARPTNALGALRPLLTATREQLTDRLQKQYDSIKSFNATVDLTPALGSVYKGQITEYKDIRAYILYQHPADIRIIGLAPVVRNKLFDMVSTGEDFRVLIPIKNRFIEGRNDAPPISSNSLENLRPETFLEAMLIAPPAPQLENPVLDSTDEEKSNYVMIVLEKTPQGRNNPTRLIYFDRTTLFVNRQKRFNESGEILSDTRYRNWKVYDGISFPSTIDINRPKDGYGVVLNVVKLDMNTELSKDKFVLDRPEGTQLQVIGVSHSSQKPGQ